MQINSYLTFNGNCEEALQFYEKALGARILSLFRHEKEWVGKIVHARIQMGDSIVMASDIEPARYNRPVGITMNIGVTDLTEAERLFGNLAEGGFVMMPLAETFWALRFGMLTDRFGIPWMVNCGTPN
jgi:PhnB protein